ncbi:TylF/MycF/NovP-related O-methyltransferase [Mycolicibacterium psychrotolerans]|uniref:O-methyltransferase n=1 Tax=Mycolicibacterium psychrotolerans TaxID=216929 RepID=A0A7I7M7U2_9MYCO|nr:TylF/MycF/NovP-related O-methyltransferase [Mycolicibacterium psychrotolerans]BBX68080.1 hypothetical protein MPSYJ_15410 [Mycolicibacterium psychrotolerans]
MVNLLEAAKFTVYRTPVLNRLMSPQYPYKLDPGELCAMVGFIDATRGTGAAVVEIGVAQGDTSVFLLEHLKTTGDDRTVHLFDTFAGFTETSLDHEVQARGKKRTELDKFRYGDEARFNANLRRLGYSRFQVHSGDAAEFDWPSLGPLGAVILDIDLYQPTIEILEVIFPRLVPGGGIVLDDCLPDTPWDGSLQAYEEFIQDHALPFERAGHKGAVVRAPE